jgi:hypothetical protein
VTGPRHRFDPAEVSGRDTDATDAEVAEAMLAARSIEASIASADPAIAADLADRIMAAVRRQPAPRAAGILLTLRRRPSPAGVAESLRVAWARILGGGSVALRASALAYVALILVVGVSVSGLAAYGAAGTLGLIPKDSPRPDATQVLASPHALESPSPSDRESSEPSEPVDSPEPSETAEPGAASFDDHGGGGGGAETASPSHEDDLSGGGGGGDSTNGSTSTPSPSRTPKPSDTPHPSSDG